jgi:hypothetical protein
VRTSRSRASPAAPSPFRKALDAALVRSDGILASTELGRVMGADDVFVSGIGGGLLGAQYGAHGDVDGLAEVCADLIGRVRRCGRDAIATEALVESQGRAARSSVLDAIGGVYSAVHLDASGRGVVASDPLGVMPVYEGRRHDGCTVVASTPRLRHRYATAALAAGVPVNVISQRVGHADVGVTLAVYAHVMPGDDEDAAGRADARFAAPRPIRDHRALLDLENAP